MILTYTVFAVIIYDMCTGIEAQLLSQADIDRGVNVTFPMNKNNISVQSVVPSSTISKQSLHT